MEKQELRNLIWKEMTDSSIARFPLPCSGRVPNFAGAEIAAGKLCELPEWKTASVIVSNPDSPQRKVRELALQNKKTLIMASPGLKSGYLRIDSQNPQAASTIRGAFRFGKKLEKMIRPDLIITGCVAVDENGNRLGKGKGYGDREIASLRSEFGKVPVATTVHDAQVVDFVPHEPHDQKIDIIVTPTKIIRCPKTI